MRSWLIFTAGVVFGMVGAALAIAAAADSMILTDPPRQ